MKSENFSEWMKNPAYFATLSPTKNRAISWSEACQGNPRALTTQLESTESSRERILCSNLSWTLSGSWSLTSAKANQLLSSFVKHLKEAAVAESSDSKRKVFCKRREGRVMILLQRIIHIKVKLLFPKLKHKSKMRECTHHHRSVCAPIRPLHASAFRPFSDQPPIQYPRLKNYHKLKKKTKLKH